MITRDPLTQDGMRVSTSGKGLVESESAPRDFYVSRDDEQVYTLISKDAATASAEETIYLQNTSTDMDLIVDDVTIASDAEYRSQVKFVTGTAAGGSALTPVNLNKSSSNQAAATARGDGSVTGLTDDGLIAVSTTPAAGSLTLQFEEALRLGQNDAIAVESLSIADVAITIEFHFEKKS